MPATEFTIQPNSARNDGSWRWLFAVLAITAFAIALRFAALGFWLILPFAILEIAALALGLWIVLVRSAYTEKVRIDADGVEVRHLQKGANKRWRFPPGRAQVKVRGPVRRWYPHRLIVGCAGQWVEIGRCLTDAERHSLAAAIGRALQGIAGPRRPEYARKHGAGHA